MKINSAIKGLMLYSFHSASGNITFMLTISLLPACIFLVTGAFSFFVIFAGIALIAVPCSLIMSAHKDSTSKWNRFQLTMPVKRKDVIAAKYLSHLLLLLVGIGLVGIFTAISIALHENLFFGIRQAGIDYFPVFIGIALLAGGLFYPLVYTVGENKEEALSAVCIAGAGGIFVLISWILNMTNLTQNNIALLCITITMVLLVCSYMTARNIYANKDM